MMEVGSSAAQQRDPCCAATAVSGQSTSSSWRLHQSMQVPPPPRMQQQQHQPAARTGSNALATGSCRQQYWDSVGLWLGWSWPQCLPARGVCCSKGDVERSAAMHHSARSALTTAPPMRGWFGLARGGKGPDQSISLTSRAFTEQQQALGAPNCS